VREIPRLPAVFELSCRRDEAMTVDLTTRVASGCGARAEAVRRLILAALTAVG
jgi:hypothetical protein